MRFIFNINPPPPPTRPCVGYHPLGYHARALLRHRSGPENEREVRLRLSLSLLQRVIGFCRDSDGLWCAVVHRVPHEPLLHN